METYNRAAMTPTFHISVAIEIESLLIISGAIKNEIKRVLVNLQFEENMQNKVYKLTSEFDRQRLEDTAGVNSTR